MNDDLQAAEDGLANGTSSFHKMGKGMVAFLRATLGFEPEIMREGASFLVMQRREFVRLGGRQTSIASGIGCPACA
ncbi:MAG: hypothetical protein Q9198_006330 [Flavoplaca austrocitrina]